MSTAKNGQRLGCILPSSVGLETTVGQIEALGRRALRLTGDVTHAADLQAAVAACVAEFGALEVAVNCAGGANATPAETMPLAQWQRMLDVNLTGVAEQLKAFAADTPVGRIATVDEMVGPVIFLASQASAFCTGLDLMVDGGFVCW